MMYKPCINFYSRPTAYWLGGHAPLTCGTAATGNKTAAPQVASAACNSSYAYHLLAASYFSNQILYFS